MRNSVTLTVIGNITSNYGEGLGNIASTQKVFRNGKAYAIRSKESLKNGIMTQSGFYDDLEVSTDGVTQKIATEEKNASNCRALEGGYMNTSGNTTIRKSSFYLTDAVSVDEFVNEYRFHNNLFMAQKCAEDKGLNLQSNSKECGLMPYQYEYDKSLKKYSITIDLDMIGEDENFDAHASKEEKADRVNTLLDTVENLSLVVKGNLDNAEPLLVVGGIVDRKTHYFDNVVNVKRNRLEICDDLQEKLNKVGNIGLLKGGNFDNEEEIVEKFNPMSISGFFEDLKSKVNEYYGV